jgi:RHS repeat-associated protein
MANTLYTHLGGMLVAENDGGTERSYLSDLLGSTQALADSGQSLTDTFDYWPFGEVQASIGSDETPYKFVGDRGIYDDGDELLFIQRRHYLPKFGRWTQRDFVTGDWTRYSYCGNDPINYFDDNGLLRHTTDPASAQEVVVLVGKGVAGVVAVVGLATAATATAAVILTVYSIYDIINYATTGETGAFTGLGQGIVNTLWPDEAGPTTPEEWNDAWDKIGRPAPPFPGSKPRTPVLADPCDPVSSNMGGPLPERVGVPGPGYVPGSDVRLLEPCAELCDFFCVEATSLGAPDGIPTPSEGLWGDCVDECIDACRNGALGYSYGLMTILFDAFTYE